MEIAFLLFVIVAYIAVICGAIYVAFGLLQWLWSGVIFVYEAFYSAFNGMINQQLISEHFLTLGIALCVLSYYLGKQSKSQPLKIKEKRKKK